MTETWTTDSVRYRISYLGTRWSRSGVSYSVKAKAKWDTNKHPRDKHGRFVRVGVNVRMKDGTVGEVVSTATGGKINVQAGGKTHLVAAHQVVVVPGKPAATAPHPTAHPSPSPAKPKTPKTPKTPKAKSYGEGTGTISKIDMASSQRKAIIEAGLEDHDHAAVREAAELFRDKKPMAAEHLQILADAIRKRADSADMTAARKKSLRGGADRIDTMAAHLTGIAPEHAPKAGTKIAVGDVKEGDLIALPGSDGTSDVRTVLEAKPWYGQYRFKLADGNGKEEVRYVTATTDAYRLPPPGKAVNGPAAQDEKQDMSGPPKALHSTLGKNGPGYVSPAGHWYDTLAKLGHDSDPIPVSDLNIEGYTVAKGWAFRSGGRSYLVEPHEGEGMDDALTRARAAATLLESVLTQAPEEKRSVQRGLALVNGANPHDAHWAKKYGIENFQSAATGGLGSTTVWNGEDPRPTTLAHEFGHNFDASLYGTNQWLSDAKSPVIPGQEMSWQQAIEQDKVSSSFYADGRFIETRKNTWAKPITPGADGVSTYGASSLHEDFAESVRLYMKDKREGKIGYDPTTGHNLTFGDVFPERSKILDAAFGEASDYDTTATKAHYDAAEKAWHMTISAKAEHGAAKLPTVEYMAKASGLSFNDVESAKVAAMERFAKEAADKAKAEAEAKKLAEELAAKKAKAKQVADEQIQTAQEALEKGLLESADAAKIKKAVAAYRTKMTKQGLSGPELQDAVAAYEAERIARHFGLTPAGGTGPTGHYTPGLNASQRLKAGKFLDVSGKEIHPLAENQNGYEAAQAKANISAELAARLNNPDDWELYRKHHNEHEVPNSNSYPSLKKVDDFDSYTEKERQDLLAKAASQRVAQWAMCSGDSTPESVVMQQAVKEEFGVTGHAAPAMEETAFNSLMEKRWPVSGEWYRRVARVQYEHTQEEFAKAGITHISLYRGMYFTPYGGKPLPGWVHEGTHEVDLQPANSWSTKKSIAKLFSKTGAGAWMLEASIPVDLVLGSARTGFGCLNEFEYVVFSASGDVEMAPVPD